MDLVKDTAPKSCLDEPLNRKKISGFAKIHWV